MKITMKNEKIIKVLVADNSEFAKNNLRDFLESSEGIQLINVVDNGKDAYHFIMDEAPDIVLIDVILPVMDGFTVIEKVNANKSIKKKPSFIIISSMGNQSMVEYACKLGVLYYMMKPYNLDSMLHRIFQTASSHMEAERDTKKKERKHLMKGYGISGYMENTLENDVTDIIREIGIPAHIKGYQYLRQAIILTVQDMELKSLKKKFKDKKFAAGCSRDVIARGAEALGWELDRLMQDTISAMQATDASVREELKSWLGA